MQQQQQQQQQLQQLSNCRIHKSPNTSYNPSRQTKLGRQTQVASNYQLETHNCYYITSRQLLHYITYVCVGVCVFSNCKLPTQQLHYKLQVTRLFLGLFLVVQRNCCWFSYAFTLAATVTCAPVLQVTVTVMGKLTAIWQLFGSWNCLLQLENTGKYRRYERIFQLIQVVMAQIFYCCVAGAFGGQIIYPMARGGFVCALYNCSIANM